MQVLLNTLVYFNTKYFMLRTAEDHQRLSFTHVMKHWKKNSVRADGQKAIILRYYPPAKRGKDQRNSTNPYVEIAKKSKGWQLMMCRQHNNVSYTTAVITLYRVRTKVLYFLVQKAISNVLGISFHRVLHTYNKL